MNLSCFAHCVHEKISARLQWILCFRPLPHRVAHPLNTKKKLWVLSEIDAKIEAIQTSPENQIYGEIKEGDTVIDVGANVGSWSLTAAQLTGTGGRVIAIEPVPEAYTCLARNTLGFSNIASYNLALGSRSSEAEVFTLFPHCCALSMRSVSRNDPDAIEATLSIARYFLGFLGFISTCGLYRSVHSFIVRRLLLCHSEQIECKVKTLSQIIEEQCLSSVDLVKVNVERDEEAVLEGVKDCHWPIIKAMTLQVHDLNGRVRRMEGVLRKKYSIVRVYQEKRFIGCSLWMIEAKR